MHASRFDNLLYYYSFVEAHHTVLSMSKTTVFAGHCQDEYSSLLTISRIVLFSSKTYNITYQMYAVCVAHVLICIPLIAVCKSYLPEGQFSPPVHTGLSLYFLGALHDLLILILLSVRITRSEIIRISSKNSAPLIFRHPITTFRQGSSDIMFYMECMHTHGWMWKFLSKYLAKRENNLFALNVLKIYGTKYKSNYYRHAFNFAMLSLTLESFGPPLLLLMPTV